MPTILVVDDEPANVELARRALERERFEVLTAHDGAEALTLAPRADLVVLDVMMPGLSGMEVAEELRTERPELPILMLTALTRTDDKVEGLMRGADDYLTKPYDLREFVARVQVLLRRSGLAEEMVFGPLRIRPRELEATLDGQPLELSRTEFQLLLALARHPGNVFSRERLLERVWGPDYDGIDRVVDVRLVSLRKKLGEDGRAPRFIETVRGLGYRFRSDAGERRADRDGAAPPPDAPGS